MTAPRTEAWVVVTDFAPSRSHGKRRSGFDLSRAFYDRDEAIDHLHLVQARSPQWPVRLFALVEDGATS